jgi:hypothetical protein
MVRGHYSKLLVRYLPAGIMAGSIFIRRYYGGFVFTNRFFGGLNSLEPSTP